LVGKGECQVSTLLYCLGEDAKEVVNTTHISVEDRKKYQKVIEEFNNNFKVKKNIIYERAHFNQQSQFLGESVDCFITEIHRLVDNSEFGGMKDELICNRLVVGIWDSALSERLQLESELTLDEAKQLIQQQESVKLSRPSYNSPKSSKEVVPWMQ